MYRELLKKTGTYALAGIATRAVSFVLLPLYTRFLTPKDYGVMELLDMTTSIIGLLLGARVGSALFYYYFLAATRKDKDQYISSVFFFSISVGLVILAITLPGAELLSSIVFRSTQYGPYFRLLFLGFACSLPMEAGYSAIRAFNRPGLYVRLTVLQTVAGAIFNVIFLTVFHLGIRSMLISNLIVSAVLALFVAWWTLAPIELSIDRAKIFQIFRYCAPLGLSGLAVFLIHYGDRIFLVRNVSFTELGIYALAYKFGMLIAFVHAPFNLYWTSQVCDIVKRPDGEKIYVRSTTLLVAGLVFVTLLLALFSEPVTRIMTGPAFAGAALLIPWLGCAYLIRAVGAHLQCIFTVEGKPGMELQVNAVGSAACLIAYATLIPRYRLWGAVEATLIGFGVILGYGYWEAQRLRRFPFEYGRLFRIVCAAMVSAGAFYSIHPTVLWLQIGVATVCGAIFPVIVFYFCLDRAERDQVMAGVTTLLRKRPMAEAAEIPA